MLPARRCSDTRSDMVVRSDFHAAQAADIGVMDSEPNVRNKVSSGKITAACLVQCLEVIGSSSLQLWAGQP